MRSPRLGEFLKRQLTDRSDWNCSTLAADWCVELGYPDFAAEWRGVTDVDGCAAAHMGPGELLSLWDDGIGDALFEAHPDDLMAGDIAVVQAMGHEAGAIFTGGKWALRGRRGLHFLTPGPVHLAKAWRPSDPVVLMC